MVKVEMSLSEDEKSLILKVKGHAGQAEPGKDLVCASCSVLAYTLAQCALNMYKAKSLAKKPTTTLGAGDATVVIKPKKDYWDEALHTFGVVGTGYNLLARNYPEYVQFKMFDKAIEPINK